MSNESSRAIRVRVFDIAIAALAGGVLGAFIAGFFHPRVMNVDSLHAKQILVEGERGTVSINGDYGISLMGEGYAAASLLFHEPGTGDPGTGGPVLYITGKEPSATAFMASPTGQEVKHFKHDESEGP